MQNPYFALYRLVDNLLGYLDSGFVELCTNEMEDRHVVAVVEHQRFAGDVWEQ
jgi:hypothetical protein